MPKSSPVSKQVDSKSNLKIHLRCLNPADVFYLRARPDQAYIFAIDFLRISHKLLFLLE